jgi:superfamily II DNA or RNA helicase
MLSEQKFALEYSTGEIEPSEFYYSALCNSNKFDLGLGFFHSSGFQALAFGFAKFLHLGGKMRIIINDNLEEEDKNAIERGMIEDPDSFIEAKILKSFDKLFKTLSRKDEHFFNCLSYLIASKNLQIQAVVSTKNYSGIAHQKYGLFYDGSGNRIGFNGSANFSKNAMENNLETLSCYCSWREGDLQRIEHYEQLFNKSWEGRSEVARIIPLEKVKVSISKKFPPQKIDTLISAEKKLSKRNKTRVKYREGNEQVEDISSEGLTVKPSFPFESGPRQYQLDAYNNWKQKNFQGIFAMATGTGKTITSLNCVLEEYKNSAQYYIVILVPSLSLVEQWKKEISKFSFTNIFEISGNENWRKRVTVLKNSLKWDPSNNFAIISTYQSFTNDEVVRLINDINSNTNNQLIIIADEAHNIGSESVKTAFAKINIQKRIALSATPKRNFDPEGTSTIEELFSDEPPYCYNFSLRRAIEENYLSTYFYYPIIVRLDGEELEEYMKITIDIVKRTGGNIDLSDPFTTALLLKRKRIINKAKDKINVLRKIIRQIGEEKLKYTFLYAPEGSSEEDDQSMLKSMQDVIKGEFPNLRYNSITSKNPSNLRDRFNVLRGFEEGRIDVLFAMKILDEGVDVPRTEIGIFASSTGNPRQFIQRRGRLLRLHPNKLNAKIYDMIVVPNFNSKFYNNKYFKTEQSFVKKEMTRVAYFASLSLNFTEARDALENITEYYNLSLSTIISELEDE